MSLESSIDAVLTQLFYKKYPKSSNNLNRDLEENFEEQKNLRIFKASYHNRIAKHLVREIENIDSYEEMATTLANVVDDNG